MEKSKWGGEEWEKDVREKIQDLKEHITAVNHEMGDWEVTFAKSMVEKLQYPRIRLTPKQFKTMMDIWDAL